MTLQISLPPLADPAETLTLDRFLVPIGASAGTGQPIAIVASDRFEWLIPASSAGTVAELLVSPGDTVAADTPLLTLTSTGAADVTPAKEQPRVSATPLARRIAAVHDVALGEIQGGGPGGRIMRADVMASCGVVYPEPRSAVPAPLEPVRRQQPATPAPQQQLQTAERPAEVVPHALTACEVDLTAVREHQRVEQRRLARRGIVLDHIHYVAAAVAAALVRHRDLNAAWTDAGIVRWGGVRLQIERRETGVAAVVDAAELSIAGIARALAGPTAQQLQPTFRIASGGASRWGEIGGLPRYGALLHVGAVAERPAVVADKRGETVAIRPGCVLTLAYDARIVAQAEADAFLAALRRRLEHFPAM